MLLSTLEYYEHEFASMNNEGENNALSNVAKCLCSSKGDHL